MRDSPGRSQPHPSPLDVVRSYATGEHLARAVAAWVARRVGSVLAVSERCTLVPSAGKTPTRTYQLLSTCYSRAIDWRRVTVVQMDEYAGIGLEHPGSLARYLYERLIAPLGIGTFVRIPSEGRVSEAACRAYDRKIEALGGIDVAVHGIGENGHIGFNEPGSPFDSLTRVVELAERTRRSNAVGAHQHFARFPSKGVTIGLDTLRRARSTMLLASGPRKLSAMESFLHGPVGVECPATVLWGARNLAVAVTRDCTPVVRKGEPLARGEEV